jgi:hypothetical protein
VRDALAGEGDGEEELLLLVRTGVPVGEATARTAAALAIEAVRPVGYVTSTVAGPVFDADVYELDERLPRVVADLDRAGLPDARLELFEPAYAAVAGAPRAVLGFRIPAQWLWAEHRPKRRAVFGE